VKSPLLAKEVARLALTKKAADVVIMDLRGLTSVADFFVVCSGDSDPQIRAIADAVDEGLELKGATVWHKESWMSSCMSFTRRRAPSTVSRSSGVTQKSRG
jgi:ribosomal silencing factor RsfS